MSHVYDVGIALLLGVLNKFPYPKFGKFLKLEETKNNIFQAVKRKEEQFPELVASYVSTAFLIPIFILEHLPWDLLLLLFSTALNNSAPKITLPILKPSPQKDKKEAWDYEGRSRVLYIHLLAQAYGWTERVISNLDTATAIALIQEIITDEQLDKEFLWNMSDRSYIWNSKTNSGRPNPLDRPFFMKEEVKEPVKTQIPVSILPVGASTGRISEEFKR